jgi:hypothetical protein
MINTITTTCKRVRERKRKKKRGEREDKASESVLGDGKQIKGDVAVNQQQQQKGARVCLRVCV